MSCNSNFARVFLNQDVEVARHSLNQSTILLVCEQYRGMTRHHVLCRWSSDTVLLF